MNTELLMRLATKYIWWKSPEDSLLTPDRIIAQVMDIGDYADVQALIAEVGEDPLRRILARAEAGQFSPKSWAYWHYRLGLSVAGKVPDLPRRKIA